MENTSQSDKEFIRRSVDLAKESVTKGGYPAGAVIVKDGKILSEGISIGYVTHDSTAHSEMDAIRKACKELETLDLTGATIYVSAESCLMCFCAEYWSNISRMVYASRKTEDLVKRGHYENNISLEEINRINTKTVQIDYILEYEKEMWDVIKDWEESTGRKEV